MADFNRQLTGYLIVKRVLQAIGLPVPPAVAGATDTLSVQMWSLLTDCGQELLEKYQWQFRKRIFTITTVPGTKNYDLPADFDRFVDNTEWNATARIPALGPMTDQEMALLEARQLGGTTLRLQYVVRNNQIQFYYVPTTPNTINFTYISRGWVIDAVTPTTFKDEMQADGDKCLYDPELIISLLRLRWREAKGFDVSDLLERYNQALESAKNNDTPGRDLMLSRSNGYPYIGNFNLPDTGIGL